MLTLPPFFPTRAFWRGPSSTALRLVTLLSLLSSLGPTAYAQVKIVPAMRTVAGTGTAGYSGNNGPALSAQISTSQAVAVDINGNLYIADTSNFSIRKVDRQTGVITTIAGTGVIGIPVEGGLAASTPLKDPRGVAVDRTGNIYISESVSNQVWKVNASNGRINRYAGDGYGNPTGDNGLALNASLYKPQGLATDAAGNLYIADSQNFRIRRIDALTHVITTLAGSGKVDAISGDGGAATSAQIGQPLDVAVDAASNLYIVSNGHGVVRKVTAATGVISTIAGSTASGPSSTNGDGGAATSAYLPSPVAVEIDPDGNLYITENASSIRGIRRVDARTRIITTLIGSAGIGSIADDVASTNSAAENPYGLAIDAAGYIYFADWYRVRKVDPLTGSALFPSTPANSRSDWLNFFLQLTSAQAITSITAVSSQGNVAEYTVGSATGCIVNGITNNAANTICTVPIFFKPRYPGTRSVPLKVVTSTGTYYVGLSGVGTGPQVALNAGTISTVAGDGTEGYAGDGGSATSSKLKKPYGVTTDKTGNLYISDTQNNRIRKLDAVTGKISTVAGNGTFGSSGDGGPATSAQISYIFGNVKVDDAGNIYIPDTGNNRVRKVDASTGIITTIAGGGNGFGNLATNAQLTGPRGVAIDSAGNLYIADSGNGNVRRVSASTGIITTVAGSYQGFGDASGVPATSAFLFQPADLALDSKGNLYIADTYNFLVRKVDAVTGIITTVAGKRGPSQASSGDGGAATDATFDGPFGIALDAADNLYITDGEHAGGSPTAVTNNRIRKVDAATGIIHTIGGVGPGDGTATYSGDGGPATDASISAPNSITVDSLGNIYFADTNNNAIRKIDVNAASLTFASTQVGSTSADSPRTASLSNIGNDTLNIVIPGTGHNPSISAGFNLSSSEATACPSVGSAAFIPSQIAAGGSCTVTVSFVPQSPGTITGALTFTDNALNSSPSTTHSIALNGTATSPVATLTFEVANHVYGDAPFTVAANSTSTGAITYSVVSGPATVAGNIVTLSGVGTVVLKASQDADANYALTTQTASFDVTAASPTLTFSVGDHTFGDPPFAVTATSKSSGEITYSVVSGPATIAGNTVTLTGAGTVVLKATQAADANYAAASQTATFTVATIAPTLTFTVVNHTSGDAPFAVAATSNSTGAITYSVVSGPATIAGNTVTLTGAGTVVLKATQAAAGNYAATSQNATFSVAAATAPSIAFTVADHVYGDAPFSITATSNSAGALSYSVLSGPATLSGTTLTLTGFGDVTLQVSQAAHGAYLAATKNAAFHVSQATLTLTANNATRIYGTANPTFTGTLTGAINGDTFSENFNTAAILTSAVASYPIVPSASGARLSFYALSITNGTLTVTKAGTVTSLSANNSTITPGASATLSAQVSSSTTGTPTGTVTFFDGATTLGTSPISGGVATYTAASLSSGTTHTLTATYNGDTNFNASTSTGSVGVAVASLDFTFTPSGTTSQTVVPGGSVSYRFAVAPTYGVYPATVSFAVAGLPTGATSTITPSTISSTAGSQTVTVTIQTARLLGMQNALPIKHISGIALALLLLPLAAARRLRRSGLTLTRTATICFALALAATLTGCGSGYLAQTPKDYAITITATSGSVQHTSTVTLNAQ